MIVLAVLLTLNTPPDCSSIKSLIAQHGKIAAYAWARINGYSAADIARIRKACQI